MREIPISIDRQQVAEFCARHHIQRLALFGSVLGPELHTPGFLSRYFRDQVRREAEVLYAE